MNADVRPLQHNDWLVWRALRLEALRESPQAFGSTYEQWRAAPDESWLRRLRDVPFNALAYDAAGTPCGIVSGTAPEDGVVGLISLWVAPHARGRGAGDALVRAVIAFAREQGASRVQLAVRETNLPAIALYRRHGFADGGQLKNSAGPAERGMALDLC